MFADGVVEGLRAAFNCDTCGKLVWQGPCDFLQVGAWPTSLDAIHLKTVVDQKLLQLWDSIKLHNPQASLGGFLRSITHAARHMHPTLVCPGPHDTSVRIIC